MKNDLLLRCGLLVAFMSFSLTQMPTPASAQGFDRLTEATRVQRFGGEIPNFMRIVHMTVTPENPQAAQTVRVDMELEHLIERDAAGLPINGDSILFIQAFGEWFPINALSTIVRDRPRNSFVGRQLLSFTFQAPVNPGKNRVRILFTDSGVEFNSFFGGNRLDPNAGARMWAELEFFIIEPADAVEMQKIPDLEFRSHPEIQPFVKAGNDFCNAASFVPASGGTIAGVGTFGGYEISPRTVYAGDEVAMTFRLKHDPSRAKQLRHLVFFGNWLATTPLAYPIPGKRVETLPSEDIITVRFPAPRDPKDYRVRLMLTDGEKPSRSFFGGVDQPGRDNEGPALWTEIPLRVVPRLNMFNISDEIGRFLIFDEMPVEKQVSPYGGGLPELLNVEEIAITPEEPAAGETVTVRMKIRRGRTADPRPLHMNLLGTWNNGALVENLSSGQPIRGLPAEITKTVTFRAPEEGGSQRLRLSFATSGIITDFYGKGATRGYSDILFWVELPMNVSGGRAAKQQEAAAMLERFIREGRPVIEHQPVLMAAEGVDVRLFATIVCPRDVPSVTFHYRHDGDSEFESILAEALDVRDDNRRTYGTRLTGTEKVYPTGFQYYISVPDTAGATITLPFLNPRVKPIQTLVDKDDEAPIIAPLLPAPGEAVKTPTLVVKFHVFEDPQGIISGIDQNSLFMTLDGQKIVPEPEVLETRFGVPSRMIFALNKAGVDIKDGPHTVAITCRDLAGNISDTKSWTFRFRNPAQKVGRWQIKGVSRSNYQHADFGTNQNGEGGILTEDQTLEISRNLPWHNLLFRSSASFQQRFPGTNPRELRGTTTEKMTTAFVALEIPRKFALTIGDGNIFMPSNLTSRGTMRGIAAKYSFLDRFEWSAMYEPKFEGTSGLTSSNIDRQRWGARLRADLTKDGANWVAYSRHYVHEFPITTSIGVAGQSRGNVELYEMNLDPLSGPYRGWAQGNVNFATSRENANDHRIAYTINLSGRIKNFNYQFTDKLGEPDFGRLNLSSLQNDVSGRSASAGLSLLQNVISLSLQGGKSHDNVFRQKAFATISENVGGGFRIGIPKLPQLSYNYTFSSTLADNAPRTSDARNVGHNSSISHSWKAFSFAGSHSQTSATDNITHNVTLSRSMNWNVRWAPSPELNLSYSRSPSRTHAQSTLLTTYSDNNAFSMSYRFWRNQGNLNLGQSISTSKNSIFTARTRTESLTGGLSYSPNWPQSRFKPALSLQYQRSETDDRMLRTRTRQETLTAAFNLGF